MALYEQVLANKLPVYEPNLGYRCLSDCEIPYDGTPLLEIEQPEYFYVDIDGDSIDELIISAGDTIGTLVLKHQGAREIFAYAFSPAIQWYTDGTCSWSCNEEERAYGECEMSFYRESAFPKEIWRIVNDGEPNAAYYIEGKPVTREELEHYRAEHPKTNVAFLPLEKSWHAVTLEEALQIASDYWGIPDGSKDVALGTTYIFRIVEDDTFEDGRYYRILLQAECYSHWEEGWETRPPYRVYTRKTLLVDSLTGGFRVVDIGSEGK